MFVISAFNGRDKALCDILHLQTIRNMYIYISFRNIYLYQACCISCNRDIAILRVAWVYETKDIALAGKKVQNSHRV